MTTAPTGHITDDKRQAMGRVLLAGLSDEEVAAHLVEAKLEALTHRTTTDPARLRAIVSAVREQGFALVDEELELGLRSLSVPLRTADGRKLAALNLCAATARVSVEEMHTRYLPAMYRTACAVSNAWTAHPAAGRCHAPGR